MPTDVVLKIWKFEDFEALERRILLELAGREAGPGIRSVTYRQLAGPSQAAIDLLAGIAEDGGPFNTDVVLETYKTLRKAKGHAPFDPWTDAERTKLDLRYSQHLEEIEARWPGAIIHPAVQSENIPE
jgi:hypothetical protein